MISPIKIKDIVKPYKQNQSRIKAADERINKMYKQIKTQRFHPNSIEKNIKNIVILLQKWRQNIRKTENNIINQINNKLESKKTIKIDVLYLTKLQDKYEKIVENQLYFIRFLLH